MQAIKLRQYYEWGKLKRWITVILLFLLLLSAVPDAYGAGFAINTQGASPLGRGLFSVAHADDPTAIFFNPALINNLEGT